MREDIGRWALSLAALAAGALASLIAIIGIDNLFENQVCNFESILRRVPAEHRNAVVAVQTDWSPELCNGVPDKGGHLVRLKEGDMNALRKAAQARRASLNKVSQYFKILAAGAAMFWLYAFSGDISSKRRRQTAPNNLPAPTGAAAAAAPGRVYYVLSKNYPALFCYGIAASACIYFTASTAGTAAANYITSNTYLDDSIRIGGDPETIRELHFAQFLDREIDPRPYDRLAWHFFFEEGNGGESCNACAPEIGKEGLEFRDNLSPTAIQTRLGSIIGALATCASDNKPVELRVTSQSSRRAWCGCTPQRSDELNQALTKARAEKIRGLFHEAKAAVETKDKSVKGKVVLLAEPIDPYPFDFSDKVFHGTDGKSIAPGAEVPPSPYYLAQTAALVLEDPSTCAALRTSGGPQP